MTLPAKTEILELSISERVQLVEDIWDSIADSAEHPPLTAAERIVLDERLEDLSKDPTGGDTWENVKNRIRARK